LGAFGPIGLRPAQCRYLTIISYEWFILRHHQRRRGRDRMVAWFTTIFAISVYHH